MRPHRSLVLMFLISFLSLLPAAQAQPGADERRLLRIESRVYGWYGVAEPEFDRSVGRRQLYKINAGENFLKGLDKRLVILEGKFSEGQLDLGELAPPPISVTEGSRRQVFVLEPQTAKDGVLVTADGYQLKTSDPTLLADSSTRRKLDLVVTPLSDKELQVVAILKSETVAATPIVAPPVAQQNAASPPLSTSLPSPQGGALLELELTQGLVDTLVDLGRAQADLSVSWQMLSLKASQLRIILPDGAAYTDVPWRLEGTFEIGLTGTGSLAETSFVISARPIIADNILVLEPNWDEIKLEGQLPFAFALDASALQQLKQYLPQRLTVMNLSWVSDYLRSQGLVGADEQVDWFLAPSSPGTLRLGLGPKNATYTQALKPLTPGNFRLQLSAPVADRLVRRGVQAMLDPEKPFVLDPPIQVGKALFFSIKVEKIYLRSLDSGYSNGAFRFKDMVVDIAWKVGPLGGIEPLLAATGLIRPRLSPPQGNEPRYWDWDLDIESLTIRSTKMPGDKEELAAELIPRLERELGSEMAQKQKFPARLPLSAIVKTGAAASSYVEITDLKTLDTLLELEGRLVR